MSAVSKDVGKAPRWAWSVAALLAASVFALSGAVAFTTSWQIDRAEIEEHRALFMARGLSEVARRGGDDAVQRTIEALAEARPELAEAFVIGQGRDDSFGISREHRYSAALNTDQRGAALDPLATADPAQEPQAPRHKLRIDRFSRVITGMSLPATPQRALPTFALAQDQVGGEVWHAAQVPVVRKDPGSAGATFRATIPANRTPWWLLVALTLLGWALCGGVILLKPRPGTSRARFRSATFVAALVATALLFGLALDHQYTRALAPHVEQRLEDARLLHQVAQSAGGLDQAGAAALITASDLDYTGAQGLLLQASEGPEALERPEALSEVQGRRYTLYRTLLAWLLTIMLLILGLAHRFMVRAALTCRHNPYAYAYVLPSMVGMGVLVFIPFLTGVGLSVFAYEAPRYYYIGLGNFAEILLGSKTGDVSFYWTFFTTILWTVSNVFLHAVIGLGLAMILKDPALRFKKYYQVLLIIPWAIPNYITALIWKGMFNKEFGAVNRFIEAAQGVLGMDPSGVDWLGGSFATAFTANLVTNTWLGFPFMMVVSLGALQSIPDALYEAADVDGASRWQKFRHITLPLLKPALFPAIILGSIWTFNMFNVIYLVSGGGPDHATEILITDAYRAFAELNRYGLAAAYSVLIFVILFVYTLMTNRITRATEGAFE